MPLPALNPTLISVIRDDLRLTTWILLGACIQSVLVLTLPPRVAILPAALLLGFRIVKTTLMTGGLIHDTTQDRVIKGRHTAQLPYGSGPDAEKGVDEEMVLFIIGARSNQ
jgi:hypothetical protein